MTKKAWIFIVASAVVVIVIALLAIFWDKKAVIDPGSQTGQGTEVEKKSTTRLDVPADAKVPDANSNVDASVAKPTTVSVAAPGATTKFRTFSISINNNELTPSTVIINVGDIAHIDFTAVDRSYDIYQPDYGFKLNISKGEKKLLEGQYTSTGKYIFYCQSCGGPEKGPVGYIIVVPK